RLHGPYLAGATLILAGGLPGLTHRYHEVLGGSNGLTIRTARAPPFLEGIVSTTGRQAPVVWHEDGHALRLLTTITPVPHARGMRMIRDDETAAAMSGDPVGRTKVVAFVVSAAAGGLAGGLQVYVLGTATPSTFTLALSLTLLAALVLGGIGSLWGALWAAIAVAHLELWASDLARALDLSRDAENNLPIVFFGIVLFLVIRFWPLGVHGALQSLRTRLRPTKTRTSTP